MKIRITLAAVAVLTGSMIAFAAPANAVTFTEPAVGQHVWCLSVSGPNGRIATAGIIRAINNPYNPHGQYVSVQVTCNRTLLPHVVYMHTKTMCGPMGKLTEAVVPRSVPFVGSQVVCKHG